MTKKLTHQKGEISVAIVTLVALTLAIATTLVFSTDGESSNVVAQTTTDASVESVNDVAVTSAGDDSESIDAEVQNSASMESASSVRFAKAQKDSDLCDQPPGILLNLAKRGLVSASLILEECGDDLPPGIVLQLQALAAGQDEEPADETAPIISDIEVTDITESSATVNWTTDEASTSRVYFGTSTPVDKETAASVGDSNLAAAHSKNLTGLTAKTEYFFIVESIDEAGNTATSDEGSFTTEAVEEEDEDEDENGDEDEDGDDEDEADTAAPVISNIETLNITESSAAIAWDTNEASTSRVYFGTVSPVDTETAASVGDSNLVTEHSKNLMNLAAGTKYFFVFESTDEAGNTATSDEGSFTTIEAADTEAPVISNVEVTNITDSSATVTWTTDEDSNSRVDYSLTSPVNEATSFSVTRAFDSTRTHSITLNNLSAETTYFFVASSADDADNVSKSDENSFATLAVEEEEELDETAPVISNVATSDITESSATITWDTDESSNSKVYFSNEANIDVETADSVSSAELVSSHSIDLSELDAETTYFFIVESADEAGNVSMSEEMSFDTLAVEKPADTEGPVISNIGVSNRTSTSVTVGWATDEASTSRVFYSTASPIDTETAASVGDANLVTAHSKNVTGLSPDTTYFFMVESTDESGNTTQSSTHSFRTLEE
ncbi:MAG: fibronectin type III domain-containing protein [Candidatus Colwellbacteria bacterium]|nr:fibronectin type III domain-containing protein [Candidatus Colwellbacteria bacterium]